MRSILNLALHASVQAGDRRSYRCCLNVECVVSIVVNCYNTFCARNINVLVWKQAGTEIQKKKVETAEKHIDQVTYVSVQITQTTQIDKVDKTFQNNLLAKWFASYLSSRRQLVQIKDTV